ncbi:ABC transporter ATP-binding protein [Lentilactobacillus hilgardii]|uniref:ABC transporter ATP-binding protein n=1 Tax=Lentilactobacillus hilgardii TaxID=1588 RepID=UPI0021A69E03|nr:ABC transporter ATP-binding protein [Lentilactobacillus hilgardii]MCT3398819.1 ABC transporter ATP-binding protein [Lentilactobacillus hilgardii]
MKMIETKALSKQFGKKQVISDVNLNVDQGDIYGFLGLNGAGKSTTMRLLLKMINPTSGSIMIEGKDASSLPATFWNHIGYMIETPHAYPNFTVKENLVMYAKQRLIQPNQMMKRIETLADQLLLTPYLNVKVKDLSLGNNQKVGLVKTLIHQPAILLLDEPTNGLDPESLVAVRTVLKRLAENGTTIFISSHLLAEMEEMVNRIGILAHGHLLRELSFDQFDQERETELIVQSESKIDLLADFLNGKRLETMTLNEHELAISGVPIADYASLLHTIEGQDFRPTSFNPVKEDLESFFLRQIGDRKHVVND